MEFDPRIVLSWIISVFIIFIQRVECIAYLFDFTYLVLMQKCVFVGFSLWFAKMALYAYTYSVGLFLVRRCCSSVLYHVYGYIDLVDILSKFFL